jgi:hypothetical protein
MKYRNREGWLKAQNLQSQSEFFCKMIKSLALPVIIMKDQPSCIGEALYQHKKGHLITKTKFQGLATTTMCL